MHLSEASLQPKYNMMYEMYDILLLLLVLSND